MIQTSVTKEESFELIFYIKNLLCFCKSYETRIFFKKVIRYTKSVSPLLSSFLANYYMTEVWLAVVMIEQFVFGTYQQARAC